MIIFFQNERQETISGGLDSDTVPSGSFNKGFEVYGEDGDDPLILPHTEGSLYSGGTGNISYRPLASAMGQHSGRNGGDVLTINDADESIISGGDGMNTLAIIKGYPAVISGSADDALTARSCG